MSKSNTTQLALRIDSRLFRRLDEAVKRGDGGLFRTTKVAIVTLGIELALRELKRTKGKR